MGTEPDSGQSDGSTATQVWRGLLLIIVVLALALVAGYMFSAYL